MDGNGRGWLYTVFGWWITSYWRYCIINKTMQVMQARKKAVTKNIHRNLRLGSMVFAILGTPRNEVVSQKTLQCFMIMAHREYE